MTGDTDRCMIGCALRIGRNYVVVTFDRPVPASDPQTPALPRDDGHLAALSALTAHRYASTDAAVAAVLAFLVERLGMRTSYLTRIDRETERMEVIAAHNPGQSGMATGTVRPLRDAY
jgi:hypothetical protein